jgi:hypothetical protein
MLCEVDGSFRRCVWVIGSCVICAGFGDRAAGVERAPNVVEQLATVRQVQNVLRRPHYTIM